jgi:hypothetical protein
MKEFVDHVHPTEDNPVLLIIDGHIKICRMEIAKKAFECTGNYVKYQGINR